MPSENNINNFELISFQRSSITKNGNYKEYNPYLEWRYGKKIKKNPVNEIVYRIFFVAPRVGLEPTTARLTAACSTDWAIEDYNKNTVLSLDYVSGTFFSTFKTAYSFLHPTKLNLFLVLRHYNRLRSYAQMLLPFRGHSYLRLHSSVVYASSRGHS